MSKPLKFSSGPGALVAAAFIGPGTVTTCVMAGTKYGYALLWAMMISTLATILLQSFAVKTGIITGKSIENNFMETTKESFFSIVFALLITTAIVVGNTAYEAGNLSGAYMGFDLIMNGNSNGKIIILVIISIVATIILLIEKTRIIISLMGVLVAIMSLAFVSSAIGLGIDAKQVFSAFLKPSLPNNDWLMVASIIGTTIVPYNIYLHASLAAKTWKDTTGIPNAIRDAVIFIAIGGCISGCIIITASHFPSQNLSDILGLRISLENLMGKNAHLLLGAGLFAAGLSSAVTAPLAASMIIQNLFSWKDNEVKVKLIRVVIVLLGMVISISRYKPLTIIWIAQIANGLLLPITVIILLATVNKRDIMGKYILDFKMKMAGAVVLFLSIMLCFKTFYTIFMN